MPCSPEALAPQHLQLSSASAVQLSQFTNKRRLCQQLDHVLLWAASCTVTLPVVCVKHWQPQRSNIRNGIWLCRVCWQGMGVLDKVVLVFKEGDVFWNKNADFLIMTPNDWSGRW
jgi:hypothetical protein